MSRAYVYYGPFETMQQAEAFAATLLAMNSSSTNIRSYYPEAMKSMQYDRPAFCVRLELETEA